MHLPQVAYVLEPRRALWRGRLKPTDTPSIVAGPSLIQEGGSLGALWQRGPTGCAWLETARRYSYLHSTVFNRAVQSGGCGKMCSRTDCVLSFQLRAGRQRSANMDRRNKWTRFKKGLVVLKQKGVRISDVSKPHQVIAWTCRVRVSVLTCQRMWQAQGVAQFVTKTTYPSTNPRCINRIGRTRRDVFLPRQAPQVVFRQDCDA